MKPYKSIKYLLMTLAIIFLFTPIPVSAAERPASIEAFLSQNAVTVGGNFEIAVVVSIKPGYHIGAFDTDLGFPTSIHIEKTSNITFDKPVFPAPKLKQFSFAGTTDIPVYDGTFSILIKGHVSKNANTGKAVIPINLEYQACTESSCLQPETTSAQIVTTILPAGAKTVPTNTQIFENAHKNIENKTVTPIDSNAPVSAFEKGLIISMILAYLMGLGVSFTPCVYPMIPVTIGYFGMQSESSTKRQVLLAALYVIGIALSYSIAGTIVALTGGVMGAVLQHPMVPLVIAAVLIALALSMFGLYELKVPSFIASRSQGKTGIAGAVFMGLLFGPVSAPCVGPVTLGILLHVAKIGDPITGFLLFFALALGIGTPFFFLAIFSSSLNRIPKAGMWMITVRKALGFVLIGVAIYYLQPFISRFAGQIASNLALPIFTIIAGLYIGWIDRTIKHNAVRVIGTIIILVGIFYSVATINAPNPLPFQPYSDSALAEAKSDGKPVMIDFTAEFCAYCKELEHKTFPSPAVKAEAKRFVCLRADQTARTPEAKAREKRFDIVGLPTIVFIDSSGREVKNARIVGFVTPDELVYNMRQVK